MNQDPILQHHQAVHVMVSCVAEAVRSATKIPESVSVQIREIPMDLDQERVRVPRSAVTMWNAVDRRCALTESVCVRQRIRVTVASKEVEVEEEEEDAVVDAEVFWK